MHERFFDPTIIGHEKTEKTKADSKKALAKKMLEKFYAKIKTDTSKTKKFLKDATKFYTGKGIEVKDELFAIPTTVDSKPEKLEIGEVETTVMTATKKMI